jgi:dihydrofolate reductase
MTLSLIVAVSNNQVIGRNGDLPWRLSSDLKRFKRLTMGHHLLMGRKTYESIGRPLPGRTTVVLTRQVGLELAGATIVHNIEEALVTCATDDETFVVGGAEIFQATLPWVQRMYVTHVHSDVEGDCYFPDIEWTAWHTVSRESFAADEKNEYPTSFVTYERNT